MRCPQCNKVVDNNITYCPYCQYCLQKQPTWVQLKSLKSFFTTALVLGALLGIIVLAPSLKNEPETLKETETLKPPIIITPPPDIQKTLTNSIGMEFMLIPAGEFDMGSPKNEKDRYSDEGPVHRVKITKAFYMGKYEV